MTNNKTIYLAPEVLIFEVMVEHGFIGSDGGNTENLNEGWEL